MKVKCFGIHSLLIVAATIAVAATFGVASVCSAQNLLSNGDLESWSGGIPDDWRWYSIAGASGSITQTTAPGTYTSGSSGALVAWNNNLGDTSMDRWNNQVAVSNKRIYKLLVDAKYASGEQGFYQYIQVIDTAGNFVRQHIGNYGAYLTSQFQTFGLETRIADGEGSLSLRLDARNYGLGAGTYVDNVRLLDVTDSGNRMINGEFENSNIYATNWRPYNVGGAASTTIVHDSETDSNAALLSVTSTEGVVDIGLDTWFDRIGVVGGEALRVSLDVKRIGATNSQIMCQVLQFAAPEVLPYITNEFWVNPVEGSYTNFSQMFQMDANAQYAYIGFRVMNPDRTFATGDFMIDNVYMGAVPEPGSLAALAAGLMSLLGLKAKRRI